MKTIINQTCRTQNRMGGMIYNIIYNGPMWEERKKKHICVTGRTNILLLNSAPLTNKTIHPFHRNNHLCPVSIQSAWHFMLNPFISSKVSFFSRLLKLLLLIFLRLRSFAIFSLHKKSTKA